MTSKELSNCSGDHHKAYYTYIHTKVHTFYYVVCGHWGEFLVHIKMHLFCYQKDRTRSRSVSVHSYLTYDTSRAHRRGRGDKTKKEEGSSNVAGKDTLLIETWLNVHDSESKTIPCVGTGILFQ